MEPNKTPITNALRQNPKGIGSDWLYEECEKLEQQLFAKTAEAESWESTCRVMQESKLPCGHPNDCGYDMNGDGRFARIGCVWCERDRLMAEFRPMVIALKEAHFMITTMMQMPFYPLVEPESGSPADLIEKAVATPMAQRILQEEEDKVEEIPNNRDAVSN